MKQINIILTDDHQLFRDGIKSLLNDVENINIVGEASNYNELKPIIPKLLPDIIILDISLPDKSGIEITQIIKKDYPYIKVLILSMHNEEEFIINALDAGADGYLPKDTKKNELESAIKTICKGEKYLNKNISNTFLNAYLNKKTSDEQTILTNREKEIVKLVSEGYKNQEIAEKLFISIRTVDAHKNNIMKKLKLKSTVEIVKYAIKNKIIDL